MEFNKKGGCANPKCRAEDDLNKFAFCADCWSKMPLSRRSILEGNERVIYERILPAVPRWKKLLVMVYRVGMVGAAAWLVHKR